MHLKLIVSERTKSMRGGIIERVSLPKKGYVF